MASRNIGRTKSSSLRHFPSLKIRGKDVWNSTNQTHVPVGSGRMSKHSKTKSSVAHHDPNSTAGNVSQSVQKQPYSPATTNLFSASHPQQRDGARNENTEIRKSGTPQAVPCGLLQCTIGFTIDKQVTVKDIKWLASKFPTAGTYVKMSVWNKGKRKKKKTSVIKIETEGARVFWEELKEETSNEFLTLSVWTKEKFKKNQPIGGAFIPLQRMEKGKLFTETYSLKPCTKGDLKSDDQVRLSIKLTDSKFREEPKNQNTKQDCSPGKEKPEKDFEPNPNLNFSERGTTRFHSQNESFAFQDTERVMNRPGRKKSGKQSQLNKTSVTEAFQRTGKQGMQDATVKQQSWLKSTPVNDVTRKEISFPSANRNSSFSPPKKKPCQDNSAPWRIDPHYIDYHQTRTDDKPKVKTGQRESTVEDKPMGNRQHSSTLPNLQVDDNTVKSDRSNNFLQNTRVEARHVVNVPNHNECSDIRVDNKSWESNQSQSLYQKSEDDDRNQYENDHSKCKSSFNPMNTLSKSVTAPNNIVHTSASQKVICTVSRGVTNEMAQFDNDDKSADRNAQGNNEQNSNGSQNHSVKEKQPCQENTKPEGKDPHHTDHYGTEDIPKVKTDHPESAVEKQPMGNVEYCTTHSKLQVNENILKSDRSNLFPTKTKVDCTHEVYVPNHNGHSEIKIDNNTWNSIHPKSEVDDNPEGKDPNHKRPDLNSEVEEHFEGKNQNKNYRSEYSSPYDGMLNTPIKSATTSNGTGQTSGSPKEKCVVSHIITKERVLVERDDEKLAVHHIQGNNKQNRKSNDNRSVTGKPTNVPSQITTVKQQASLNSPSVNDSKSNNNHSVHISTVNAVPGIQYQQSDVSRGQTKKQRTSHRTGIPNVGNTCYANSVLQVLGKTPFLQNCLEEDNRLTRSAKLLQKILTELNLEDIGCVNRGLVTSLFDSVFTRDDSFRIGIQNDSHAFLLSLLNCVKADSSKNPCRLFEGMMSSRFTYSTCKHEEYSDEQIFTSLLMPIDNKQNLYACIDAFCRKEEFEENLLSCRVCTEKHCDTVATRQVVFTELPEVLVLQMGRFEEYLEHSSKRIRKTSSRIKFYKEIKLEKQGKLSSSQGTSYIYNLYGVVNHLGSIYGGHYTACVNVENTDNWYSCSDSCVSSASCPTTNLNEEAYLLFYRLKGKQC